MDQYSAETFRELYHRVFFGFCLDANLFGLASDAR